MFERGWLGRMQARSMRWLVTGVLVALYGGTVLALVTYGTVQHTARSEFCNSCHIMEPYYESWQHSSHHDVACIECHYEPGAVETLEGKFKALSQLAKYVTRTAGTKPWAEVSDQSCMRSGCHSVRMLEGPVEFGRVKFDHRQHLLESQRGRRLRCVTCHSQIVQGEHISVTSSVCFTCHFMPDLDGAIPEKTSDCLMCHGPPEEDVLVDGRPFSHAGYVARGVDCRECHDPVIEGEGTVRKERCHSCHGEVGHIERIGEIPFMHEKHVTQHKVECFECHDEIHHGLLPLQQPAAPSKEGCGSCHESPHDAAQMLYAGTGAAGVPDQPSRMYQTRVVCKACHTGRTGVLVDDFAHRTPEDAVARVGSQSEDEPPVAADAHMSVPAEGTEATAAEAGKTADADPSPPRPRAHAVHGTPGGRMLVRHAEEMVSSIAAAGNADCIRCHGTGYDGMLSEWQAAVGEQLDRLLPLEVEVESRIGADRAHAAWTPLRDARKNLGLVAMDGSRGVHNVSYALDALRAGAAKLDEARALAGVESATPASEGFPFESEQGCSDCHAGAGRPASVWPAERNFPHAKHLFAAGLDCDACHTTTPADAPGHGHLSIPRNECASCHHQERPEQEPGECASCHGPQEAMLRGRVTGFAEKPWAKSEMDCYECHGEIPDVLRPSPAACVLCHEPGYDAKPAEWKAALAAASERVRVALRAAEERGADAASLERARAALAAVEADGSGGVHNFDLASSLLEEALQALAP